MSEVADKLAELVLMVPRNGGALRSTFGSVVTVSGSNVTVYLDSMDTGAVGPLQLVCGKATVGARVLCLYLPDNNVWVVIGR